MASSLEVLRARERLRVGQRFLILRPFIAAVGAGGNALFLSTSAAPSRQKLVLGLAFSLTIGAFFLEAGWLRRRPLTEAWLLGSLALTLLALGTGAAFSGGLMSPVLPLLFAPVVVGFAAFAQARPSRLLLLSAIFVLCGLGWVAPLPGFGELPQPTLRGMLLVSSLASLALLAVGVIGLVEAHTRIAQELERRRADLLDEAERRALSVEHLGAQVAHEVKNPLAAARGLVQLVARHTADARDKERLDVVVQEVDRALGVLHDYLSFSKPLTDLSLGVVDLRGLLQDVAGVLEARAHEKGLTLRVEAQHAVALADRRRLREALLNLALNAVAALPHGGHLTLRTVMEGDRVRVQVDDDGPGMGPELLARLGRPFTSEAEGGTGLGVLLAQSVARQHGGQLRFESTLGAGTRAWLELPAGAHESSSTTRPA